MHSPGAMVQFSLILECYLRANRDHLEDLHKQKEALGKLFFVTQVMNSDKYRAEDTVCTLLVGRGEGSWEGGGGGGGTEGGAGQTVLCHTGHEQRQVQG